MREIFPKPGRMCASLASSGKVSNASRQPLVECRIWLFGYSTKIGATGHDARSWSTSALSKCLKAPVSDISDVLLRDVDVLTMK